MIVIITVIIAAMTMIEFSVVEWNIKHFTQHNELLFILIFDSNSECRCT